MNGKQEKEKSEKLFEENQPLVLYMANKRFGNMHYDDDMIQEGMIALWKAALSFDESKNTQFSTYAARCIGNAFNGFLRTNARKQKASVYLSECLDEDGDFTLESVVADLKCESMESEVFFKCFMDSLDETERIVAEGLVGGESIQQISRDNGRTDTWGHYRKKKIAEKYRKWMN